MGGGGKSKSNYKNPVDITSQMQLVAIGAVRAYAGVTGTEGGNLSVDSFIETVRLETERDTMANSPLGHPLYKPFMVRRVGQNVGKPVVNQLVYDNVTGKFQAFLQLQEGMRGMAGGKVTLIDDINVQVGDTLAVDDLTYGVRRLLLVEGLDESPAELSLDVIDVLGG